MARVKEELLRVREILARWDPIGLGDVLPPDEYDSYAPAILSMLRDGAPREGLVHHLVRIRTRFMGLEASPDRDGRTADELLEWWSAHTRSSTFKGVSMNNPQLTQVPVAKTGMLIRKPVAEVFEAFVNPDITTRFWFTRSSGRLEAGKEVQWEWEMYGISVPVTVKSFEPGKRILIEWPGHAGPTTVEWLFTPLEDGSTFVTITNDGFTGDGDELVKQATDSTEGFTLVLAGLKALLEHDVRLNLVADRYPKGIEEH